MLLFTNPFVADRAGLGLHAFGCIDRGGQRIDLRLQVIDRGGIHVLTGSTGRAGRARGTRGTCWPPVAFQAVTPTDEND